MSSIVEKVVESKNLRRNEIQEIEDITFILNQFPSKKTLLSNVVKKRRCYKIVDEELLQAVINNDNQLLESLYKLGYNIYANNDYLLRVAIKNNSHSIAEFLLKNGCDPTANYYECFHSAQLNKNDNLLDLLLTYHTYHKSIIKELAISQEEYMDQYKVLLSKINDKKIVENALNF